MYCKSICNHALTTGYPLSFFGHIQNTSMSVLISPIIYHEKNTKNTTSVYKMRKWMKLLFCFGCGCEKIYGWMCVYPFSEDPEMDNFAHFNCQLDYSSKNILTWKWPLSSFSADSKYGFPSGPGYFILAIISLRLLFKQKTNKKSYCPVSVRIQNLTQWPLSKAWMYTTGKTTVYGL